MICPRVAYVLTRFLFSSNAEPRRVGTRTRRQLLSGQYYSQAGPISSTPEPQEEDVSRTGVARRAAGSSRFVALMPQPGCSQPRCHPSAATFAVMMLVAGSARDWPLALNRPKPDHATSFPAGTPSDWRTFAHHSANALPLLWARMSLDQLFPADRAVGTAGLGHLGWDA